MTTVEKLYYAHIQGLSVSDKLHLITFIAQSLLKSSWSHSVLIQNSNAASDANPNSIMKLHGLGAEIWHGIDAQTYVNELRDEWEQVSLKSSAISLGDEQLTRECEVLANLKFDDIGTAEEWLIIENEALLRCIVEGDELAIP